MLTEKSDWQKLTMWLFLCCFVRMEPCGILLSDTCLSLVFVRNPFQWSQRLNWSHTAVLILCFHEGPGCSSAEHPIELWESEHCASCCLRGSKTMVQQLLQLNTVTSRIRTNTWNMFQCCYFLDPLDSVKDNSFLKSDILRSSICLFVL